MLRKKVLLQAANKEECKSWVNTLQRRRSLAIRENLGHSPIDPRVKKFNDVAKEANETSLRREAEEAQHMMKEGQNLINGLGPNSFGSGGDTMSPMQTRSSY